MPTSELTDISLQDRVSLEPRGAGGAKVAREEGAGGQDGEEADGAEDGVRGDELLVRLERAARRSRGPAAAAAAAA